ncbi:MAG: hypothetical protein J6U20_03805 [Fibrobacter sp.]|nr:hypothetical protein [Fibrobacter sp.]
MIFTHHGINSARKNKYEQEYDETDIPPSTSIGMVPLDRIGWNVVQTMTCGNDIPFNRERIGWNVAQAMTCSSQDIPFDRDRIGWNVAQAMTCSSQDIPFDRDRIGWNVTIAMTETLV